MLKNWTTPGAAAAQLLQALCICVRQKFRNLQIDFMQIYSTRNCDNENKQISFTMRILVDTLLLNPAVHFPIGSVEEDPPGSHLVPIEKGL